MSAGFPSPNWGRVDNIIHNHFMVDILSDYLSAFRFNHLPSPPELANHEFVTGSTSLSFAPPPSGGTSYAVALEKAKNMIFSYTT